MFDFGIADLILLGPPDQEVYLVEFRCRCAVIVARRHVIRRTRGFRLVCEHVSGGRVGLAARLQESRGSAPMI